MADTSKSNPWRTTTVHIAPSHVYLMAVMLDAVHYPYQPHTHAEDKALSACIARGWIEHGKRTGNWVLTDEGHHVARVCRFAIARSAIGGRHA